MAVGIRELKNKLSQYLKMVKEGEKLTVTERGEVIAYITPAEKFPGYKKMIELVREGKGSWKGKKPIGSQRRAKIAGKPLSKIVIEERR